MKKFKNYIIPYIQAIPEFLSYQIVSKLFLIISIMILKRISYIFLAKTGRIAITSGDFKFLFTTWQGGVILIIGLIALMFYVIFDCVAKIICCENIIKNEKKSIWKIIREAIKSIPKFLNSMGILIILFIAFLTPIIGFGITISLTENLQIPKFITSVIFTNKIYTIIYIILLLISAYIAITNIFILHFIVLKGNKPKNSRIFSKKLLKEGRKKIIKNYFVFFISTFVLSLLIMIFFLTLPLAIINKLHMGIYLERFVHIFVCFNGIVITYIAQLLSTPLQLLELTRLFDSCESNKEIKIPLKDKMKKGWLRKRIAIIPIITIGFSILFFIGFDEFFPKERDIWVVAHRGGGSLNVENSVIGLQSAIENGTYASEIDVQRTKDGYYIINHDNTFKRLAKVKKAPGDMSLEEIKNLTIKDENGETSVATIEEMLDEAKGKIHLFIELKGSSADEKMADDIVAMIKERDMIDECVILSLNYNLTNYVEMNYPEITTGYLYYFSFGLVTSLNCDYLILEEQPATQEMIFRIHAAGKKAIVWTVNTEEALNLFLDSNADGIITDEVENANKVQERLSNRTDMERIHDFFLVNFSF